MIVLQGVQLFLVLYQFCVKINISMLSNLLIDFYTQVFIEINKQHICQLYQFVVLSVKTSNAHNNAYLIKIINLKFFLSFL